MPFFSFKGLIPVFCFRAMFVACMLSACAQGADTQPLFAGKRPRFVLVGSGTNDLGKITFDEKKTVFLRLKNEGDAPGEIRALIPTCSCISGTVDKKRVGPQEATDLRVVLDASKVHGVFKRLLWVETNDPVSPRLPVSLCGEVSPLFHGLPTSPQQQLLSLGETWTNRFTLTPAETNLFWREPLLSADTNKLSATVAVRTNQSGKTSFDVTLAITALVSGHHTLFLEIPVEGWPTPQSVKLAYDVRVGSEMQVVPSVLFLFPTRQPLTRKAFITISGKQADSKALTCAPPCEGVSVQVQPNPGKQNLMVTLTFSPEAVSKLLKERDAQLTFHYPKCQPLSLKIAGPR